jgi:hypothetical protein
MRSRLQAPPPDADVRGVERPEPRTLAIAAAIILPLAVWGWHLRSERLTVERRAAAAAAQVAGRPVEVHCPGQLRRRLATEIHDGEVQFFDGVPADETKLTGRICDGLDRLLDDGPALDLACLQLDACSEDETSVAYGVAVLTHEAVHMRGVMDEAATECEAVKRSAGVAQALGATPQAAAYIADWQFSVADDQLPENYRTNADCRFSGP